MVYPLGVPNPIEIVTTSYKLFKLYEEARGRQAKVNAANELLSSIGSTIDRLEQAGDANNNGSALAQARTARTAWKALHEYLQKFPAEEQSQRSLVPRARTVYDDLRWAINILDGKVSELKQELGLSLLAAMPTQIADLQASMALLTTNVSELRSAALLQTTTEQRLLVRESVSPELNSDPSTVDARNGVPLEAGLAMPCWAKKGGCHCRCHAKTSTNPNNSRYTLIETQGWQAFGKTCNVEKCNARFLSLRIRLAASRIWIPWAINIALRLGANSAVPRLSFTPSRVCSYTSPGFVMLEGMKLIDGEAWKERLASFKALFSSGQASHTDVFPDGNGYLDTLLQRPWLSGRETERDLVKFLIVGAPASVLQSPRLLYHCATGAASGWESHFNMPALLLGLGLDPEHLDPSLFCAWPQFDPGPFTYFLVPDDPMFIQFFRACLQRQSGFAGCDDLTEAVLTGEDSEFESALCRAKGGNGILRTPPNALGQTATHLAITSPRRLKKLLAAGADPDCVDREGLTPLMYAAAYGEQHSVLHLVEHQATWVLKTRRHSRNFLYYAISRDNLHVVESFISLLRGKGDHSTASEVLDHCIAYSITHVGDEYDTRIPHRLFELGADADTIFNRLTLMHFAETKVLSQLIMKFGFTSFHIRDDCGKTPLMQVAHLFDAKTLITIASHEQVTDFNAQDIGGKTALHHLLGSHYAGRIYHYLGTDRSWQFSRHHDMVSCLDTLLQHGASASAADKCVCACSEKGCTALTFALHRLSQFFHIDCGIVIDLLQATQHQSDPVNASEWFAAIRRFHTFEKQGLTHTCCGALARDAANLFHEIRPETLPNARNKQIKVIGSLHSESNEESCTDEDVFSSLAALCSMYEQRSIAKKNSAVAHRKRKSQLQVDHAKDEIKFCLDYESQSPIRKVTTDYYKDWLRWCDRNFVKLDIKGGRRSYTEYGWRLVSMFEDKVEELRSGTETWHTAPEQPAETP